MLIMMSLALCRVSIASSSSRLLSMLALSLSFSRYIISRDILTVRLNRIKSRSMFILQVDQYLIKLSYLQQQTNKNILNKTKSTSTNTLAFRTTPPKE